MIRSSRKTVAFAAALGYSILLFFIAAVLQKITNGLAAILTWVVYSQIVRGLVIFLSSVFTFLVFIRWSELPRRFLFLLLLGIFGALTAWFVTRLGDSVNEYVHYPQYATLVCLWYAAFSSRERAKGGRPAGQGVIAAAGSISALLGCLEEGWQHFLPGRVFDVQDILLNLMGVWLGLMLIWAMAGAGREENLRATSPGGHQDL